MKTHSDSKITKDTPFQGLACNGFLMIFVSILLFAAAVFFVYITDTYEPEVIGSAVYGILCTSAILLFIISPVLLIGLMILEPNQARAMVFFGKYRPHRLLLGQSLLLQEESLAPRPQHQRGPHQGQ